MVEYIQPCEVRKKWLLFVLRYNLQGFAQYLNIYFCWVLLSIGLFLLLLLTLTTSPAVSAPA